MRFITKSTLALLLITVARAQTEEIRIKPTPENPAAGQPVVLEIMGVSPSAALNIDWDKFGGEGKFSVRSGKQVTFTPASPGVILIMCYLSGSIQKDVPYPLKVASEPTPTLHPAPPPATPPPSRLTPSTQPDGRLPDGALPLLDIVKGDNERTGGTQLAVLASGRMGDAQTENGPVRVSGGQDCKFNVGCRRIVYDLQRSTKGWASIAWQVVPKGESANWGKYKGANLGDKGFKSFRIYAKADSEYAVLPWVEFSTGGNIAEEYRAMRTDANTEMLSTESQQLTRDWKLFCMSLGDRPKLRDVISPLMISVSGELNPASTLGFYIDGAHFSLEACPKK